MLKEETEKAVSCVLGGTAWKPETERGRGNITITPWATLPWLFRFQDALVNQRAGTSAQAHPRSTQFSGQQLICSQHLPLFTLSKHIKPQIEETSGTMKSLLVVTQLSNALGQSLLFVPCKVIWKWSKLVSRMTRTCTVRSDFQILSKVSILQWLQCLK